MNSPTDAVLDGRRAPVDRVAARVISGGVHWTPDKMITEYESQNPIATFPIATTSAVRVGMKFGAFTVMGNAGPQFKGKKKGAGYVCRCLCGMYAVRRARAVTNPANTKDACGRCLQKQFLANRNEYRVYGRNRS